MTSLYPEILEHKLKYPDTISPNVVQHWGFFNKAEIAASNGQLLMLDIDFGRQCMLKCPSCFRRNNIVDDERLHDLDYDELLNVIDDSHNIGLKSVKVCGAGEPLENAEILQFARDLTERDIGLAIFTKGHVLGDDKKVDKLYHTYGIHDAYSLCTEFFKLKTSFLVSFQAADMATQDKLVGNISGYTIKRNRGMEVLASAGFNKTMPTRLAMCTNPITRLNYHQIFNIYEYARNRNILPVIAALMVSGKQIDDSFLRENDVSDAEKEDLFVKIYQFNLKQGLSIVDQLIDEGISCMPGIHPCNQIAVGLYVTCNGNVIRCPGDTKKILGNVRTKNIVDLWNEYKDWQYQESFNCRCPYKDGITLPDGLYEKVLGKLAAN